VYADEKEKFAAYPARHMPTEMAEIQLALVQDLEHIATQIVGGYAMNLEAVEWGEEWYQSHWKNKPDELDDDRFSGYLARKQTHLHKTAMCIAAATHDDLTLSRKDLEAASQAVSDLEKDMVKVFARIGRTQTSVQAERFIRFVQKKGRVSYGAAYQFIHSAFPSARNFEDIVAGARDAGYIQVVATPEGYEFVAVIRPH
jgi:hypothetical protein